MKRLLDESTDALERSLLQVGSEIRSDGSGQARLLSMLAAAGTLSAGLGPVSVPWWKSIVATKVGKAAAIVVLAAPGAVVIGLQSNQAPVDGGPPASSVVAGSPAVVHRTVPPTQSNVASAETDNATESDAAARLPRETDGARSDERRVQRRTHGGETARPRSDGPSELVAEARLVERLRGAIGENDRELAARLLAEYRRRFPKGQLHPEVTKLEHQLPR